MTTVDVTYADPRDVVPLSDVISGEKAQGLACSMRRDGWNGPPIVVIRQPHPVRGRGEAVMYAATGAHRLDAALRAGLGNVPTVDLADILAGHGLTLNGIEGEVLGAPSGDPHHYDALRALDEYLPLDVIHRYGLDAA